MSISCSHNFTFWKFLEHSASKTTFYTSNPFFFSPELSSNEAFLNSYGSFIERAPLGQVVNIVENQDGLDKNSRNNAGGNQPQITGTNDNSVQVMSFFYKIQNYEAIFNFFFSSLGHRNISSFIFPGNSNHHCQCWCCCCPCSWIRHWILLWS